MSKEYEIHLNGVCSKEACCILDDDGKMRSIAFKGGCNGSLKALSLLLDGMTPAQAHSMLSTVQCGKRGTSCAAEFVNGLMATISGE